MSKSQIFIPKKINVGYQKREDTYTKRLAYVIYYDNKGVLRKETSWQGWRDKKIPNQEFENIPTEGFVLNKGVGGQRHSYGWNARNEYIRVYDPRNFEFEISVANLLWILQECTSTKGKGLEGEFVYGWEGKELILIPVETKEYDDCVDYTNMQDGKISAKDLVPGYVYRNNRMEDWVYLGKHIIYDHSTKPTNWASSYGRSDYYQKKYEKELKAWEAKQGGKLSHVFVAQNGDYKKHPHYDFPSSMSSFKKCLSVTPVDDLADIIQNFQENCKHAAPFKTVDFKPVNKKEVDKEFEYGWDNSRFYLNGERQRCRPINNIGTKYNRNNNINENTELTIIEYMSDKEYNNLDYRTRDSKWKQITIEEFLKTFTTKRKLYENNYTENVH